jgi:hypothetical protein
LLAGGGTLLVLLAVDVLLLTLLAGLRALLPWLAWLGPLLVLLLSGLCPLLVLLTRLGALLALLALALLAALLVAILVHQSSSSVPRNCDTRPTGSKRKSPKLNAGQWRAAARGARGGSLGLCRSARPAAPHRQRLTS